jgi:hypothetical protein
MNRHQVEQSIPFSYAETPLSETIEFDDDLRILLPGKYNNLMRGGDFVVELNTNGVWHRASATKLITILGKMVDDNGEWCRNKFGVALALMESGKLDYESIDLIPGGPYIEISPRLLLRATMLLGIHERRRTGKLPVLTQLMLGVVYSEWDAGMAAKAYKQGSAGLKALRASYSNREPNYKDLI